MNEVIFIQYQNIWHYKKINLKFYVWEDAQNQLKKKKRKKRRIFYAHVKSKKLNGILFFQSKNKASEQGPFK